MKEYDQFMQQVKGKQKAPKDGFANDFFSQKAPKDGFANDFGSPASMKAALGYDPNSDFKNAPTAQKQTRILSETDWMESQLKKGKTVGGSNTYERYLQMLNKMQNPLLARAQEMMEADQFRMRASQKGLSPETIDFILKNRIPAWVSH